MHAPRSSLYAILGALALLLVARHWALEYDGPGWLKSWQPRDTLAHRPCGIPVHFALGEVDARFGFDPLTVMTAVAEAGRLWQAESQLPMFVESTHPRSMTVSLRFDDRQRGANLRRSLRGGLDRDRSELAAHEELLRHWAERIEAGRLAYERHSEALARRVQLHEAEVAAWSDGVGERREARRRALAAESAAIRVELAEMEHTLAALNDDIAAYNRLAGDLRQQAQAFRTRIAEYNTAAADTPIESGRYSYDREHGRRIEIFRAENYDELVWILAHELGHALGLDHVDAPGAIMHALLHDDGTRTRGSRPIELHPADRDALNALCGPRLGAGS